MMPDIVQRPQPQQPGVATLPVLIPLFLVLVLITVFPSLVTGLPDLLMGTAR